MKKYFLFGLILGVVLTIRLWTYHKDQLVRLQAVMDLSDGSHDVIGTIVSESSLYGKRQFRVSVETIDDAPAVGELNVENDPALELYHVYHLEGTIRKNSLDKVLSLEKIFIGRMSVVQHEKIRSVVSDARSIFKAIRQNIALHIEGILPEPHATLVAGIVFGIKNKISNDFYQSLIDSGTIHIVVASGFNIAVVMHYTNVWSKLFFRRGKYFFLCLMIFTYAAISGFDPPIVRAILLSFGGVVAELLGEYRAGISWLFISAYIMILVMPSWLYSLSFQLSFASTAGIMIFLPFMMKYSLVLPRVVSESIATTAAASVLTMPIIWLNFGRVTLVSLITNPLILWSTPLIMGLGFISVLISYFSFSAAKVPGSIVWLLTEYILRIIHYFS